MDEIVQEFLVESHENLDQLDRDLVALEQEPDSRELLSSIFRTIHTIKGTSGFLAFGRLEQVAHVGENLLSRLRDGVLRMSPESTTALLRMVDTVRALLDAIEQNGTEGDVDVTAAVAAVQACLDGTAGAPAPAPEPVRAPEPVAAPAAAPEPVAAPEPAPAPEPAAAAEPEEPEHVARRSVADSTIRVDVDLLDQLMLLVGELVLTRNQVVQHAAGQRDVAMTRMLQRLNLVTAELQEGVMKTRMQPIDHVWNKLPRVVRDLSAGLGKRVDLEMVGKDTELDRTLLEAVKDPLTHIVRNAVDHGIEPADVRVANGKPAGGTLQLRAFHEGGRVIVEVADDGAGIDPARVGAKALQRGLVTEAQLAAMSDREVVHLVFRPGFSTAEKVTNVSGRGVGMDVVKTNIEKIGGTVDIDSVPGQGSTFRLTIPLTLAIVPALTVECGGERYAVPQISLVELVSVDAERARTAIEQISGAAVYRLRGRLLPLVRLDEVLGLQEHPGRRGDDEGLVIAVLHSEGRTFGLVVDRVLNTEEIVVKALSARLKAADLYSGAAVLGDGRVALILDVQSVAQRSLRGEAGAVAGAHAATGGAKSAVDRFLVAAVGGDRRVAIPLDMVTRLEEFPVAGIEHVGSREVVRYRGEIIPLLRLASHLGAGYGEEGDTVSVVVYAHGRRSVALVVEQILDIVEEEVEARSDIDDHGLLGSAVIQSRVTELLDVRRAILAADPHFFAGEHGAHDAYEETGHR
jgi:two-component system chemotaxis sensor kinase CheA